MPPICETMIKGGPCPGTSIRWHARQHLYLCGFHFGEADAPKKGPRS